MRPREKEKKRGIRVRGRNNPKKEGGVKINKFPRIPFSLVNRDIKIYYLNCILFPFTLHSVHIFKFKSELLSLSVTFSVNSKIEVGRYRLTLIEQINKNISKRWGLFNYLQILVEHPQFSHGIIVGGRGKYSNDYLFNQINWEQKRDPRFSKRDVKAPKGINLKSSFAFSEKYYYKAKQTFSLIRNKEEKECYWARTRFSNRLDLQRELKGKEGASSWVQQCTTSLLSNKDEPKWGQMVKGRKERKKRMGSSPTLYLLIKIKKSININRLFYNKVEMVLSRAIRENCIQLGWTDIHLTNKGMHSINGNTSKGKRKISPSPPTKRKRAQPPLTTFGFTLTPKETKEPKEKVISNNDIPETEDYYESLDHNRTKDSNDPQECLIPKVQESKTLKKRKCSKTNKGSELINEIEDYYDPQNKKKRKVLDSEALRKETDSFPKKPKPNKRKRSLSPILQNKSARIPVGGWKKLSNRAKLESCL
jgi:hypothetical protein